MPIRLPEARATPTAVAGPATSRAGAPSGGRGRRRAGRACAAIDLGAARRPVVVLDDDDTVSVGSRAICYAKRTLEILDRLGCGDAMCAQGRGWNVGKVFFRDELVYRFELVPEAGHDVPRS